MGASIDVATWLQTQEHKSLLRFITCGSVDDGKSTLIGRLLYDTRQLFDDQLAALEDDSRRIGTQGGALDFALLVDGLSAEREQGITIDVAYRYFATAHRKFIVADSPGHPQYTRNMVTAASTADVAVLLVDARKGILAQTRRHSHLASLLGIRHVAVAINKMDLVDYAEKPFRTIVDEYAAFAKPLRFDSITCLPISAVKGDNVIHPSEQMPWFHGTTLMGFLETVEPGADRLQQQPLRMPVQWVCRPGPDFRGFAGTLASGIARAGDAVRLLPSGRCSTIARIVTADGDLAHAVAGQSVMLTLSDELDLSRGDVICAADAAPPCADQFECTLVWLHDEPALPGRSYLLKLATSSANAQITDIKYEVDVNSLSHLAAKQLALNAIGVCNLGLDRQIAFDPYQDNRALGGFILIDRLSHRTVGAGMLHFGLRRAQNIQPQPGDIDKTARAALKQQKPCLLWLTGISGAGKSALANSIEARLTTMGRHTYLLDGNNVRHGLNKDLGFTDADRVENIRRVAETARLMVDAGLIVITAFISPFRAERQMARSMMAPGEFIEVFVDTPLALAEQRDAKGLYAQARRGELKNFTGVSSPYQPPEQAELRIDTTRTDLPAATELVIALLRARGILDTELTR
jgi:bifunctional enzyme CysN/CysC